jgi:hypothetical protein
MAIEIIVTDGIAHAGVGVVLSLLDFFTYKLANPKARRMEQKKACLQAIEILLDTEKPQATKAIAEPPSDTPPANLEGEPDSPPTEEGSPQSEKLQKDSTEYAEQIATVRDYLRTSGIVKLQLPVLARLKDSLRNLVFHEKINNLSNVQKLGVAFGVEVLYDILFDFHLQAVAGIAASLYQIPAFFIWLWVGNGVKKVINFLIAPGDEKKIDTTIQQLLRDTPIVDIIVKYVPSEKVKSDLAERGIQVYMSQLTQAGKGAYKHLRQIAETAKSAAGDVIHFAQKQEEKEQQEREERQKRFDELTKGR